MSDATKTPWRAGDVIQGRVTGTRWLIESVKPDRYLMRCEDGDGGFVLRPQCDRFVNLGQHRVEMYGNGGFRFVPVDSSGGGNWPRRLVRFLCNKTGASK